MATTATFVGPKADSWREAATYMWIVSAVGLVVGISALGVR